MIRNSKLSASWRIGNSLTKTFFVRSFGCQYNEWDAARLSYLLKNAGLVESKKEDAEIIFLLNCSVRKSAVDRTFGMVKNFLKENKKVVITGCILDDDKKKFEKKGCLIWDGKDIHNLGELLGFEFEAELSTLNFKLSTNLVPIMKGCNNFCSYCAVPYTREREVSRPAADILNDIKSMIASGQKEIILLGQNVNSYVNPNNELRIMNNGKSDFSVLLEQINDIPGDFLIKFTSNHPKDMDDDIIDAIATLPKIAKEIHLPVQSGSNKVLRSMNRPYSIENYLALVGTIKKRIPNVILTTDVIVGFPTETEKEFQKTVELFKKIHFHQAYINKYSPRSGTAAFKLGDPIPWAEKERRWRILNDMIKK